MPSSAARQRSGAASARAAINAVSVAITAVIVAGCLPIGAILQGFGDAITHCGSARSRPRQPRRSTGTKSPGSPRGTWRCPSRYARPPSCASRWRCARRHRCAGWPPVWADTTNHAESGAASARWRYTVARETPNIFAMSVAVMPFCLSWRALAEQRVDLAWASALAPVGAVWRLSAVRPLPDSPSQVPCPSGGPGSLVRIGKSPTHGHSISGSPGPWQTRQFPVGNLRLRPDFTVGCQRAGASSGIGRSGQTLM